MKPIFAMTKKLIDGKPAFELVVERCNAIPGLIDQLISLGYTTPAGYSAGVCKIIVKNPAEMNAARAPLEALKNSNQIEY